MKKTPMWGLVPLLILSLSVVQAENVRQYGTDDVPNPDDIANILGGGDAPDAETASPVRRSRGLMLDSAAPVSRPATAQSTAAPAKTALSSGGTVSLPIQFAYNSADILPNSQPQLDALAAGLKKLGGKRIVVEGHTDAKGSASYNISLSRRRAEAVRQYLVSNHGISASSLLVEGKGSQAPLNPNNPLAPENRRVQFRAAR